MNWSWTAVALIISCASRVKSLSAPNVAPPLKVSDAELPVEGANNLDGGSLAKYPAAGRRSVRIILTEQCGSYDLMVSLFTNQTRSMLGNIPITILQACSPSKKRPLKLRSDLNKTGVDQIMQTLEEEDFRMEKMRYTKPYPFTSRPHAVVQYLEQYDLKEEVIVMAEYDWVWLNADTFWDFVNSVQPGMPAAATYTYLIRGLRNYQDFAPITKDGTPLARKILEEKRHLIKPVGVPVFLHREDFKTIAPRWLYFTDDLLNAQEQASDGTKPFQYDRVTEMYSYIVAAAEAGLDHQVPSAHAVGQFSPGYDQPEGLLPLFGHYAYSFHLCGTEMDKGSQYGGPMEHSCRTIVAPPEPSDIMSCDYGETYWKSGGGGYYSRTLALKMWKQTYAAAKDICANVPMEQPTLPEGDDERTLHILDYSNRARHTDIQIPPDWALI